MKPEVSHETSAGIVVYRRTSEGPKFLLLYHGGRYWNFPKGHVELLKGNDGSQPVRETSFRAAIRETCEETGLRESELKLRHGFRTLERYLFNKNKTRVSKIVIFYLAETKQRQIRISDEHEGFGWFKYKDALRLLSAYRENALVIRRAHSFISQGKPDATSSGTQRSS